MALEAEDFFDPIFTPYGAPTIAVQPQNVTIPNEILSAYEPIVFELEWAGSTATDITNVRMEAELSYGDFVGGTDVVLGTIKKTSITVSGFTRWRFDFSDMLKTVLNPEFYNNITSDQITTNNRNIVESFEVSFTCKYNDNRGVERVDTTKVTSVYYVCNVIIPFDTGSKLFQDASNGYLTRNSTSKFLTKAANNKVIYANENEQLSFMTGYSKSNLELNYQTYDLNGSANTAQTKALVDCAKTRYGTLTISDNGASTIIDDFANISKVDIWLKDNVGTQVTEKRTYLIKQNCASGYRLWWANSLGGVDKYTFNKYTNKTFEQEQRKTFQKPLPNSGTLTSDISKQTFATNGNYKYTAVSEFRSSDLEFFVDLINSTEVYYEHEPEQLLSVVITSTTQTVSDSDGMIQVIIEFELSQRPKTHIA